VSSYPIVYAILILVLSYPIVYAILILVLSFPIVYVILALVFCCLVCYLHKTKLYVCTVFTSVFTTVFTTVSSVTCTKPSCCNFLEAARTCLWTHTHTHTHTHVIFTVLWALMLRVLRMASDLAWFHGSYTHTLSLSLSLSLSLTHTHTHTHLFDLPTTRPREARKRVVFADEVAVVLAVEAAAAEEEEEPTCSPQCAAGRGCDGGSAAGCMDAPGIGPE